MTRSLFETLSPIMIVGLEGPRLGRRERALLAKAPPAGIILFSRNVEDARQLRRLTGELEKVFIGAQGMPPIVAADHEGGVVSVLADAIGTPPSQMAAGRTGDSALIELLFAETARRMLSSGVNMMLGPVADINSEQRNPIIGTRSFGEDVETVRRSVAAAVRGARGAGILTCLKHFPGHGPTSADSHLTLPVLASPLERLEREDFLPFADGFEAGAESVMIGHVVPGDRSLPASLDPAIVTDALRGRLRFTGVAMTDALEMAGVRMPAGGAGGAFPAGGARRGGGAGGAPRALANTCMLALGAGNDVLLLSKPVGEIADELDAAGAAAIDGREEWLAARARVSVTRIDRLIESVALELRRPGRRSFDDTLYRRAASVSVRMLEGSGAWTAPAGRAGFKAVFWSEREMFARPPVKAFVARIEDALGAVAGRGEGAAKPPSGAEPSAAPAEGSARRDELTLRYPGLRSTAFSFGEDSSLPEVAFLMNRNPLDAAAVRDLCSGASAVVVAEWPYAAPLVGAGVPVIVTHGVYESAAERVMALLIGRAVSAAAPRTKPRRPKSR